MQSTYASSPDPYAPCSIWRGKPDVYQEQAGLALLEAGRKFFPWCWVVPTCGNFCLSVAHLTIEYPQRLSYPRHVCVYCGLRAFTRDHLLPRGWTGDTVRNSVLTVPACGECNSLIGSVALYSITERREFAHTQLRRKHAKVLRRVEYSRDDLREFGPGLRPGIIDGLVEKHRLGRRLRWPIDAAYDLRALQRSGIEDPYAFGILKHSEMAA